MAIESVDQDLHDGFPLNARGYFIASLGAFCFGLSGGPFLAAVYSFSLFNTLSIGAVLIKFTAPIWPLAIFGYPSAYLRHSLISKLLFGTGLVLSTYLLLPKFST